MQVRAVALLPSQGKISATTWGQVADGQLMRLRNGRRPAVVIADLEGWEECRRRSRWIVVAEGVCEAC